MSSPTPDAPELELSKDSRAGTSNSPPVIKTICSPQSRDLGRKMRLPWLRYRSETHFIDPSGY
jgi:hypothetical protein